MTANLQARTPQDSDTPATPVFAAPVRHPSAWTVADFRSPADYSVDLDAVQLRDIAAAIRRIKAAGIGLDGLQNEHFDVPSLRPVVEEIRRQVEDGRGFVLLRGLPTEEYSKDDLGLIFWGIGTHLGRGLSQSVMGDRLGHVKDFSREDPGARAYLEAGEAAAGRPMGPAEHAVIDTFEAVTKRPELMLEFTLQPGEAYFINNYTILHARTAFDDGDAPEDARRHLLRLWLDAPIRPVHPYIRSRGILPVAGRTPSFDWSSITVVRH